MLDFGTVSLEWGTMLFQAIVFLLLLVLVRKLAMSPAMAVLEKRRQHIEQEISSAERNRKESEALIAEQRRLLDESRLEAKAILDRAAKQASNEETRIKRETEEIVARMKADATADLAREVKKAKAELSDQMAGLSVMLASKIIEKELDETAQKATIDQFLKQAGDRL